MFNTINLNIPKKLWSLDYTFFKYNFIEMFKYSCKFSYILDFTISYQLKEPVEKFSQVAKLLLLKAMG